MTPEPEWLSRDVVLTIHSQQIALYGGASGVRDGGLLDTALARPRNLWAYGSASLVELGAAYAVGIVRNHAFVDGNKRTAFLAMYTFLVRNGLEVIASEAEVATAMLELAGGSLDEPSFVRWLREHTRQSPSN